MNSRIIAFLIFVLASGAATVRAVAERELPAVPEPTTPSKVGDPADRLVVRPWVITGHFSVLDLIVPNKYGFALAHRNVGEPLWQLEYSTATFSPFFISGVGAVTEERISLARRHTRADGRGFQWFYGAFHQRLRLHVGSALLSRLSGGAIPSADLISMSGLGVQAGVGYRWIVRDNFVIGFDLLSWSQPLVTLSRESKFLDVVSNQSDRDDIDTAIRIVQYFPRFAVAKFELGYQF